MLILITVVLFQPIYNLRELHQKIFSKIPSLFTPKAPIETKLQEHTPYTIEQLKKFGVNLFVVLCLAWVTILLYEAIPRFNIPLIYSRQITTIIIFIFFASFPTFSALKALKKILEHASQQEKRLIKKFAFRN
jgi:hypothetical protein